MAGITCTVFNIGNLKIAEYRALRFRKPVGVVVVLPGFLEGFLHPFTVKTCKYLASKGFAAVAFDPRGIWSSIDPEKGEQPELCTHAQYQKDITRVLRAYRKRYPKCKIALGGFCYGGYIALYKAKSSIVDCVFAISPTRDSIWGGQYLIEKDTSWRKTKIRTFEFTDPTKKRLFFFPYKFIREVPYQLVEDERKYDLRRILPKINASVLFIAPKKDEVITQESVEESYAACGSPKKQLIVLNIKHDFYEVAGQVRLVNETIWKYLVQSLDLPKQRRNEDFKKNRFSRIRRFLTFSSSFLPLRLYQLIS